jgi:hypothetical protein
VLFYLLTFEVWMIPTTRAERRYFCCEPTTIIWYSVAAPKPFYAAAAQRESVGWNDLELEQATSIEARLNSQHCKNKTEKASSHKPRIFP